MCNENHKESGDGEWPVSDASQLLNVQTSVASIQSVYGAVEDKYLNVGKSYINKLRLLKSRGS